MIRNAKFTYKTFLQLSVVATSLLLAACGSGGQGSDETVTQAQAAVKTTTTYIEGRAVKGLVVNGRVSVYPVIEQDGKSIKQSTALDEVVRTDANGEFRFPLYGEQQGKSFVVEVTADANTTMKCEALSGCQDLEFADFGETFNPGTEFLISAVSQPVNAGKSNGVSVTAFTHMARVIAEESQLGLNQAEIEEAAAAVEVMLDLPSGSVFTQPIDLTNAAERAAAGDAQLEVALLSSALHEIANEADWDSVSEVLTHVSQRLAESGELALTNMGATRDVTLSDLLYVSQEAADALVVIETDADTKSSLQQLSQELVVSYDDVVEQAQTVTPAQITSQPVSESVDQGGAAIFTVGVIGSGPLSFQWLKDGQAIAGENQATLSIASVELADAGSYALRVSNSVGSVVSQSVDLVVAEVTRDISLSWDIPTEREDGSALELFEINGYTIKYGSSADAMVNTVNVTGSGVTEQVISELGLGRYYFAIATIDSDNVQGRFSDTITIDI
jgi:Immunoglobulin I-set domain